MESYIPLANRYLHKFPIHMSYISVCSDLDLVPRDVQAVLEDVLVDLEGALVECMVVLVDLDGVLFD